jgi:hypothetical protein
MWSSTCDTPLIGRQSRDEIAKDRRRTGASQDRKCWAELVVVQVTGYHHRRVRIDRKQAVDPEVLDARLVAALCLRGPRRRLEASIGRLIVAFTEGSRSAAWS